MPYYPNMRPVPSGGEQKKAKQAKTRGRFIRLSVIFVSCLLVLYGSVRLIEYIADLQASRNTSRELRQVNEQETQATDIPVFTPEPAPLPSPQPTAVPESPANADDDTLKAVAYPNNPDVIATERFLALRRKSQYIVGWLRFDEVDEAVVQKDNTYFLTHDATGKKNSNGAIFMDSGISMRTRPYTVILYGHNMKSGNMFGRLKKYKESSYFHTNRIITFDSMYEDGKFAVFAVMEMDTTPGIARWYDLWSLASASRAKREEAIRTLEGRSAVSSSLDVQADDQILLLVTCLDGDTERLVVAARRLRPDESETRLDMKTDKK